MFDFYTFNEDKLFHSRIFHVERFLALGWPMILYRTCWKCECRQTKASLGKGVLPYIPVPTGCTLLVHKKDSVAGLPREAVLCLICCKLV